ncbi:hypothetical protein [Marivirga sp.]|uniref:hypothetical protein n=1 Tax=Marivirga sp. TaxID=2018662 RepID=UPI0025E6DA1F|nr:hypothetical protein [Marivirga sp.]
MKYHLVIVILLISFSCNNIQQEDNKAFEGYSHKDLSLSIRKFLKSEFNLEILNQGGRQIIFFVPVSGCTPCIEISLKTLDSLKDDFINVNGILVSRYRKDFIGYDNYLSSDKYFVSSDGQHMNFNLNIGSPMVLFFDDKSINKILSIDEANYKSVIAKVESYLQKD